jgi:hypothetical protein
METPRPIWFSRNTTAMLPSTPLKTQQRRCDGEPKVHEVATSHSNNEPHSREEDGDSRQANGSIYHTSWSISLQISVGINASGQDTVRAYGIRVDAAAIGAIQCHAPPKQPLGTPMSALKRVSTHTILRRPACTRRCNVDELWRLASKIAKADVMAAISHTLTAASRLLMVPSRANLQGGSPMESHRRSAAPSTGTQRQ